MAKWSSRLPKSVMRSVASQRTLTGAVFLIALVLLQVFGAARLVDNNLRTVMFTLDQRPVSGEIVLVDIDAASLEAIGEWPWKRSVHAELIDRLAEAGAADIALDVDFSTVSDPVEDARLAEALDDAGGGVLLATFTQVADARGDRMVVNRPIKMFAERGWPATVNVRPERDGYVRAMPYGLTLNGEPIHSIAASLAYSEKPVGDSFLIDFGIREDTITRLSAIYVLSGYDLSMLEGKRVLIGASAVELRDFFLVPSQGVISGHTLQALAAESLIQSRAITASPLGLELVLACLVGAIALALIFILPMRAAFGGLAVMATILLGGAYGLHAGFAYSFGFGSSLIALVLAGSWKLLLEIDFGAVLVAVWSSRAKNNFKMMQSVITENVEGVLLVSEEGQVLAESNVVRRMLKLDGPATGKQLEDLSPHLSGLAVAAIEAMKAGDPIASEPTRFDIEDQNEARLVIEAVSTPSRLTTTDEVTGQRGDDRYVASITFRDVTARKLAEERLSYLATHHERTGMLGRQGFIEAFDLKWPRIEGEALPINIACIEIEGLRSVEGSLGHDKVSELIRSFAERLSELAPKGTELAALRDDVFIVAGPETLWGQNPEKVIDELLTGLSEPYAMGEHTALLSVCAGLLLSEAPDTDIDICLKKVASAMHQARASNRRVEIYSPAIPQRIVERQQLEVSLRQGLQNGEFFVVYQPLINLATGKVAAAEALMRWRHPEKGLVPPDIFIPVAEETGVIDQIGMHVLHSVCRDLASWPESVRAAVNISPSHFISEGFAEEAKMLVEQYDVKPGRIDLEVTESVAAQEEGRLIEVLKELRDNGFRVSIDDFGTGYSALSYLRDLPVDKLKIDRAFVRDLGHKQEAAGVVSAITDIAHKLGIETVLEGIETEEQALLAASCRVTYAQGYLFGKPMENGSFVALARRANRTDSRAFLVDADAQLDEWMFDLPRAS